MPGCPHQPKVGQPARALAQAREGIAVSSSRMLVVAEGLAPAASLTSGMTGEIPARVPARWGHPAKRGSLRAALLAAPPWVAALSSPPQSPVQEEPLGSARTGSPYRGCHGRSAGRSSSTSPTSMCNPGLTVCQGLPYGRCYQLRRRRGTAASTWRAHRVPDTARGTSTTS
jgi:hypothetical protein